MDQRIKNYIGIAVSLGICAFSLAAISYAYSYSKSVEPGSTHTFMVSGDGKAVAAPDVAEFTFEVRTEGGKDVAALQAENTKKANGAIAFVKSNGVEAKDITVESYNVEPRYESYSCGPRVLRGAPGVDSSTSVEACPPPAIVGYTISEVVQVKVRDFAKVGGLLSGVVSKGANSVSQLSFTVDDPTQLQNQARTEAIKKAKDKARAMADAGGFGVGRLVSIQENGNVPPIYYSKMGIGAMATADSSAPAPTIEPGSQEIQVTVSLTYEIK